MRLPSSVFRLCGLVVLSIPAMTSAAQADPAMAEASALRLPVGEAARPLTLPKLILAPEGEVDVVGQGATAGTFADLDLSVSLGLLDDLTVRALVAPLQLVAPTNAFTGRAGGFEYGQLVGDRGPSAGLTFRFLRGVVEMGASFDVRVFTLPDLTGVALIPAIPLHLHATRDLRLDVTPAVNITRATEHASATDAVRLIVPVNVLYDVTEAFSVRLDTGLTVDDVSDSADAASQAAIPLGATLGYAVAGRSGPIFDVAPFFQFPYLLLPGRQGSTVDSSQYTVGLTVRGYLYL